MKTISFFIFLFTFLFSSCNPFSGSSNPFPGPRKIDWEKEWEKNESKLKALTADILAQGSNKYKTGINDFPKGFSYPFDDGFAISRTYDTTGVNTINTKRITITYYVDRGLLDHYSAFIFFQRFSIY